MERAKPRLVCLSNVFDQQYHDWRGERIARCLSQAKRRDLFRCFELALGSDVLVLSSHPPALERRRGRWLPAVELRFSTHRQLFCAVWDLPRLRVPFAWISYVLHVLRHTGNRDLVVIDNYEWLYVIAVWPARVFRGVRVVLDYEDGKHLIDRSWSKILSTLAEWAGRGLIRAALLAHPALGERLPASLPTELVPGFVVPIERPPERPGPEVRFLYSGSLDRTRGVDLLLEALPHLPERGWRLDISGSGPLEPEVSRIATNERWSGRVTFHHALEPGPYQQLLNRSQVGINCQRATDPVSSVTFPSKVFSYLSAGLLVLSSQASQVERVCGPACLYYTEETSPALASGMARIIADFDGCATRVARPELLAKYSLPGTAARVRALFQSAGLIQ